MHSSRIRTACSSSHLGRSPPGTPHTEQAPRDQELPWSRHPPGTRHTPQTRHPLDQIPLKTSPLAVGLDQIPLNFPLGCGPGPDPPPLPPWVWAWRPPRRPAARHAGIPSAMHAGIEPPPQRPAARHAGIPPAMHAGIAPPPPVDRHTPVNILPCPKLRLRAVKIQ